MRILRDINELPVFRNAVVSIGSFDGVHKGHQKILGFIKNLSKKQKGESVIITFDPHPRKIIYPKDDSLRLLTTLDEKIKRFEKAGIDNLVIIPFSIEFSQQSPREYIEKFIVEKFAPKYVVIGYDHRFGLNRAGNIDLLKMYEKDGLFKVVRIEKEELENIAISSTKIRQAISTNQLDAANKLLGYNFMITGRVISGLKIGRTIDYPTANIAIDEESKLIPEQGIFAAKILHEGSSYKGMLYIGRRPTLEQDHGKTIEINIFDFRKEIYGEKLQIELVKFIRDDEAFEDIEMLKNRIAKDKQESLFALSNDVVKKPLIQTVILNYNGKKWLEKFLPSVLGLEVDAHQVIVADNRSSDDSVAFLQREYPRIRLIEIAENLGFAGGYNKALEELEAKYFFVLNSDVEVSPAALSQMVQYMEQHADVAACQPKILSYAEKEKFEYAGAAGGYMDKYGYPFCAGRLFDKVEIDSQQYDTAREIFWASGAAMLVRSTVFKELGGFDDSYFAHMEEIDLCWRMKRAGHKIMVIPSAKVYHVGGGTLSYQSSRKTFLNFRNSLSTLFKNESSGNLIIKLPFRFFLDTAAVFKFLLGGEFGNAWAVVKAGLHFIAGYFRTRRRKKDYTARIEKNRVGPSRVQEGQFQGSVVKAFFIHKKHTFAELIKK